MNTEDSDIRWVQRFQNFEKAFKELEQEVEEATTRNLSKLEKKGIIQIFEVVQELCWNVLKDFLQELGFSDIKASRDTFRRAKKAGIITQGDTLLKTINSRNLTTHTYNESDMDKVFYDILEQYYQAFNEVYLTLKKEKEEL